MFHQPGSFQFQCHTFLLALLLENLLLFTTTVLPLNSIMQLLPPFTQMGGLFCPSQNLHDKWVARYSLVRDNPDQGNLVGSTELRMAMSPGQNPILVSSEDLEYQLSLLQNANSDPCMGLFGPASLLWKVNRESLLFLGAGRALLLQLSHPWIAAAIADHSGAVNDPLTRFHRTFSVMFSMLFGTVDQAFGAARKLHRRHSLVKGLLAEPAGPFAKGTPYRANGRHVLQWVHSTLIETALLIYELALSPLSQQEREAYYRESCCFAGLFGLSCSSLPTDWAAFVSYTEAMCQSDTLTVAAPARRLARQIFGEKSSWTPEWYRAITAQLLAPRLRETFGLPFGRAEQLMAQTAIRRISRVYALLPYKIRDVGPFQEAQARLSGRAPSLMTQSLNQIWIGQRWLS